MVHYTTKKECNFMHAVITRFTTSEHHLHYNESRLEWLSWHFMKTMTMAFSNFAVLIPFDYSPSLMNGVDYASLLKEDHRPSILENKP